MVLNRSVWASPVSAVIDHGGEIAPQDLQFLCWNDQTNQPPMLVDAQGSAEDIDELDPEVLDVEHSVRMRDRSAT